MKNNGNVYRRIYMHTKVCVCVKHTCMYILIDMYVYLSIHTHTHTEGSGGRKI